MNDPLRIQLKNRLSLSPLVQTTAADRWRTEAMRSHQSPRLIFVNKGQGRVTVAGLTSGYSPNNLIFIPAGTMYGFEAGPTVFGQMLAIPAAMAGDWPEEPMQLRLRDVSAQKEAALHFDNLERELQSARTAHSRAAHHYLGILAVFFERQIEKRKVEPNDIRAASASAKLVAAYTDLVERDFQTARGVVDYAADLGVTPTHLTRCCNQTCGKSALNILNERVVFEARRLLRDTDRPIQDIAKELGFTSPAYFARSFHDRAGVTPSAFRKSNAATRV